jgi:putative membrane protein
LSTAAQQANAKMPDAIDTAHNKAMIAPFQKLTGAAFDRRFSQEMVAGHTKAIAAYKAEAADGENAALKSYAEQAIPVLQKHLDQAKTLQKPKAQQ